jgi:hypothetical protein
MTPKDEERHMSPLERAKAKYRPMRSLDEIMGITERVPIDPKHLRTRTIGDDKP